MLLSAETDASHFHSLSDPSSHAGPAGCFCSTPGPSTNTLQQTPAPQASSCRASQLLSAQGAPTHLQFPLGDTGMLGVVYGELRQRQFLCYQTAPISEGSSTQLSAAKATDKLLAMPLATSCRKLFSPGFSDFLFISIFVSGQHILQYTVEGGGRI